jgi:hypothetical protein
MRIKEHKDEEKDRKKDRYKDKNKVRKTDVKMKRKNVL